MTGKLLLLSVLALVPLTSVSGVVVETGSGSLEGSVRTSRDGREFYSFTSVPYAKPPLGELRWKNPEPVEKWEGTLDASGPQSPRCIQANFIPKFNSMTMGQEDCLYLSVFTPKLDAIPKLPVLVYIHGGAFKAGDSGGSTAARYFMDEDVVLVAVSYRLGALGFMSTEDDVITGNFGLKDQAMAIRWVKENIGSFGGDPDTITLFGPSAGGASVHYQLMTPLNKGLIKGGISESGVATAFWASSPRGDARMAAHRLGEMFNCPTDCHKNMLKCLRAVKPEEIVDKERQFAVIDTDPIVAFQPVIESKDVEGAFINENPLFVETHLPWIQGIASSEGSLKTATLLSGKPEVKERYMNEFEKYIPLMLAYSSRVTDEPKLLSMLKQRYFSSGKATMENIRDVFGDGLFLWPSALAAENHKGPQWYYYFDHRGANSLTQIFGIEEDLGVSHAEELLYLFDSREIFPNWKDTEVDKLISKKLIKLWVNFAKHGNPTPENSEVVWREFGPNKDYLHMTTDEFKMDSKFQEDTVNFWNGLPFKWNRKQAREEL